MFLTAGINRVDVNAYASDDRDAISVDYLDVTATTGTVTAYQAETGNTLGGAAVAVNDSAASGGRYVGWIGAVAANTLRVNNVTARTAGRYRMVITYANGELGEGADNYNSNIVDRYADISVNGGTARRSSFRNALGWSNYLSDEGRTPLVVGTLTQMREVAADRNAVRVEAEAGTLVGGAAVTAGAQASGGSYVGWLGNNGTLTIPRADAVRDAGQYNLTVAYAQAEKNTGHPYNTDTIARTLVATEQGGTATSAPYRHIYTWDGFWPGDLADRPDHQRRLTHLRQPRRLGTERRLAPTRSARRGEHGDSAALTTRGPAGFPLPGRAFGDEPGCHSSS